jgi:hypothetical protein
MLVPVLHPGGLAKRLPTRVASPPMRRSPPRHFPSGSHRKTLGRSRRGFWEHFNARGRVIQRHEDPPISPGQQRGPARGGVATVKPCVGTPSATGGRRTARADALKKKPSEAPLKFIFACASLAAVSKDRQVRPLTRMRACR